MAVAPRGLLAAVLLVAATVAVADDAGDVGDVAPSALVSPTTNALVPIRRSEPRSEVALVLGGAVLDERVVSGLARAVLQLEGSWAPARTWELFATVNPVAYRWVQLGPTIDTQLALGSTTVGGTFVPVSLPRGRLDGGLFLRLLLPTSHEVPGTLAAGVQAGLTFRGMALPRLAWFGGASFRASRAWGSQLTANRTGASALAGVAFVPSAWLRLVAQASANLPFGGGYRTLAPGLAVRFVQGDLAAELGAVLPLGAPVRPFSAVARVSWRLDGR